MLKAYARQCLQWQVDPATGKRTKAVFACSWQDQPLDMPDYDSLQERLAQNRLERASHQPGLEHLFATNKIARWSLVAFRFGKTTAGSRQQDG